MTVSLNQIAHSRLRFPAWLGIFAILMLFIAPIVSKTLVAHGLPMPMMAGMSGSDTMEGTGEVDGANMADMANMSMSDVSPAPSSAQPDHDHHAMPAAHNFAANHSAANNADANNFAAKNSAAAASLSASDMMGAACGYCVLLMHLPLLVMLSLTVFWSLAVVARPSPPRVISCPDSAPIFKDSQPRAPPVLISVVLPFKA